MQNLSCNTFTAKQNECKDFRMTFDHDHTVFNLAHYHWAVKVLHAACLIICAVNLPGGNVKLS